MIREGQDDAGAVIQYTGVRDIAHTQYKTILSALFRAGTNLN